MCPGTVESRPRYVEARASQPGQEQQWGHGDSGVRDPSLEGAWSRGLDARSTQSSLLVTQLLPSNRSRSRNSSRSSRQAGSLGWMLPLTALGTSSWSLMQTRPLESW